MKITKEEVVNEPLPSTTVIEESGLELLGRFLSNLSEVCFSISNIVKGKYND